MWKSVRKKGVGGEWFSISEPVEEEVASCQRESEVDAVTCSFEPEEPGLYVMELATTDGKGRTQRTRSSFYVVGGGWVSWQSNDTDRIDLVADRQRYAPGDTAKILVKSPFLEAEALLTVEREGILSTRRVRLEGSAQTVEIPIDESMIPNVFVGVLIQRGRVGEDGIEEGADPGRPTVKVGYVQLEVEKASKRLQVKVLPDEAKKRPGETLSIDVEVLDHLGRGTEAEVTVWAVDEGVLRLTNYRIPDPVEAILPLRGLSVRLAEPLVHLVKRRLYAEKGQTAGGGGGDGSGAGIRSDFRTTILFSPEVITDERGRARVEVELPDNLTTYRLMAVAVARGERFGSGEGEVEVGKPLLVLPSAPRFARMGDDFEAGVVVHAPELEATEVRVRAQVEGLSLLGEGERRVVVGSGRPVEVRFPFRAEKSGTAKLRFFVEGGGQSDGLEHSFPIVLPVSMETVATLGETADESQEGLIVPGGIHEDIGGLELTFASTALAGMQEGMLQLVEYPYGCLEQEASRLIPFIALRELSGTFGIPWEGAARGFLWGSSTEDDGVSHPDEIIRNAIRAIQGLQMQDGGFRYWPSSQRPSPGGSAYAVLALHRAKELGFPVDSDALSRGQGFLAAMLADPSLAASSFGRTIDDATKAFALWALARSGAPRPSYYSGLFAKREGLPLFAKAMLADAIRIGGGDGEQARKLLEEVLGKAKESPGELHFEEEEDHRWAHLWSSDVRTSALVLQTLATISPDHPYVPKISRYLNRVRGRDGRYRSTQEAAFALMALTEVVRVKERDEPAFRARASLGKKELAAASMTGRSLEIERMRIPHAELAKGGDLRFSKEGKGTLYYGARLSYAREEMPTDPLEKGFTVQRWLEPYGEQGKLAREFAAGELVRVQVRIVTPQERHHAVLEIPLPAGLEVVDTSLATSASLPAEEDEPPQSPWAHAFFQPFHHVERRDDKVALFADLLPPGIHEVTVVARATILGRFLLPPAHVQEMYGPEVFGRSDGGSVEVVEGWETASR